MKRRLLCTQQVLDFLSAKHVSHARSVDKKPFLNYELFAAQKPVVSEIQATNTNLGQFKQLTAVD